MLMLCADYEIPQANGWHSVISRQAVQSNRCTSCLISYTLPRNKIRNIRENSELHTNYLYIHDN